LAIAFLRFFLPHLVSKPSLPPSRQIVILLSGRSKRWQATAAWRFCAEAAPTDLPLLVAPRSVFPTDVSTRNVWRRTCGEKLGLLPAERPALDAAPAAQHHVNEHTL
jgi:hypothetical protein